MGDEGSQSIQHTLYFQAILTDDMQLHSKYSKSDLFALELDSLAPVMKDGWAIWVTLEQVKDV